VVGRPVARRRAALLLGGVVPLTIVGGSIWIMAYNAVAH